MIYFDMCYYIDICLRISSNYPFRSHNYSHRNYILLQCPINHKNLLKILQSSWKIGSWSVCKEVLVKSTKSKTVYKRLKKTTANKKLLHDLHNMFYFGRKKTWSIFTEFLCGFSSTAILISLSFLADFWTVFILERR